MTGNDSHKQLFRRCSDGIGREVPNVQKGGETMQNQNETTMNIK